MQVPLAEEKTPRARKERRHPLPRHEDQDACQNHDSNRARKARKGRAPSTRGGPKDGPPGSVQEKRIQDEETKPRQDANDEERSAQRRKGNSRANTDEKVRPYPKEPHKLRAKRVAHGSRGRQREGQMVRSCLFFPSISSSTCFECSWIDSSFFSRPRR